MLMKSRIFKLFLVLLLLMPIQVIARVRYCQLKIHIENILIHKGNLMIGIFNNESTFKTNTYYVERSVKANNNKITVTVKLPVGVYAVKLYQDVNEDQKMNQIFGMPLEPYGVSNNTTGFPSFKATSFQLNKNKDIYIKIKN